MRPKYTKCNHHSCKITKVIKFGTILDIPIYYCFEHEQKNLLESHLRALSRAERRLTNQVKIREERRKLIEIWRAKQK